MSPRRFSARSIPTVVALGAATLVGAPATASDVPEFRLEDPGITESSALAVSRSDPTLAFTVDDSGDIARVFVIDTRSGETVGITTLAGVENNDFEALAWAPDGRLLIGDIGDNEAERSSVQIHALDEPTRGDRTVRPDTVELTYADGPRDAEALVVRRGRILVVSKRVLGGAVYRGPPLDKPTGVLRPIAKAPGTVTGATVLGDGRVVLRNYTAAFVMTRGWEIAQTLMLPPTELGESIAAPASGDWFYAGSEGERSPVHRIDVSAASPAEASPSPPVPSPPVPPSAGSRSVGGQDATTGDYLIWAGLGLLVGGLAVLVLRRAGDRARRGRGRAG